MRVKKIGRVVRGLQIHALGMAEFAAVGRIDLVVADQTIGHPRERRRAHRVGFFETPVARRARIRTIEMRADVARR